MPTEFKLAAVGDILMIGPLLASAKQAGGTSYAFDSIFRDVAPLIQGADLAIGNLETPLAGAEARYAQKNARTGFTMFNCPDELAPALKSTGFHVLTTANNHSMDRGTAGIVRTLKILDEHGLAHTGTYEADPGTDNHLIIDVKGIRVGIVSYSKGTNKIPLPPGRAWMVNVVDPAKPRRAAEHIRRLARQVDVVIACLHIGKECKHAPTASSRRLVNLMLDSGAHIVLGNHPHVLQPAFHTKDGRYAIYSLSNFASTRLYRNPATNCGVIVRLTVRKDDNGKVAVTEADAIPTWCTRLQTASGVQYRILRLHHALAHPVPGQSAADRRLMRQVSERMRSILAVRRTRI